MSTVTIFGHMLAEFGDRLTILENAVDNEIDQIQKDRNQQIDRLSKYQNEQIGLINDQYNAATARLTSLLQAIRSFNGEEGSRAPTLEEMEQMLNGHSN